MGRSQATFGKKENEKKRLKKKMDKAERKEERQANAKNGNNLDEMLAYVDEFGNISSTPPDPTRKKKEIKTEDIQLGARKQEEEDPADAFRKGVVSFFNDSKGYGFIKDQKTQESIFVHANGLVNQIKEGDKVSFEVEMGQKGLNAIRVKLES